MLKINTINIFLILMVSISLLHVGIVKSEEENIIYVGNDSEDYSSIQLAIDDANQGDTVFIRSGIYYENIIIDKQLNLIGEDNSNTIIDGLQNDYVIKIEADKVYLSNLSVKNSKINQVNTSFFYTGILIESNFNNIQNCIINGNQYGIVIFNSTGNDIVNCDIYDNLGGVYISNSQNNNITGNKFFDNYLLPCIVIYRDGGNHIYKCNFSSNDNIGLVIRESNNNVVNENIFLDNPIGIRVFVSLNFSSRNNYFYKNNFYNIVNAYDDGLNNWDNEFIGIGNYWNDYESEDLNDDGIGDEPYLIPLINYDNFPSIDPIDIKLDYKVNNLLLNIIYPSNNSEVNGSIFLTGESSSDNSNITQIKIKIDSGEYNLVNGTNSWNYEIDTTNYGDGLHNISVFAIDENGNSVEKIIFIKINNNLAGEIDSEDDNKFPGFDLILLIMSLIIFVFIYKIRKNK